MMGKIIIITIRTNKMLTAEKQPMIIVKSKVSIVTEIWSLQFWLIFMYDIIDSNVHSP
jgi:hypothetical protein